jgi:prepilin-type N-terminal cleavage/methylation domain-containing protein
LESRFLRPEDGFTLPEVMVAMTMTVVVLFALYGIFDMSIRVFSFGNDKVEAVENARLGVEKMEREIRAAFPADKAAGVGHLFWQEGYPATATVPAANRITFGNDLNGDYEVYDAGANALDFREQITYRLTSNPPYKLQRVVNTVNAAGAPTTAANTVVEYVKPGGLGFRYFTKDGVEVNPGSPGSYTEGDVARVRITLEIRIDRGSLGARTQTLTTDVALRNRM